jgi:PAS domain S-box-containing protein
VAWLQNRGVHMSRDVNGLESQAALRQRALARLSVADGSQDGPRDAFGALGVLHKLASSPSSAGEALAVLHELQVHQVELELQEEELRRSRSEMEATLYRQLQLYDFAPVGCLTVDRTSELREVNLTAAGMLGCERSQLLGRSLISFLGPESASVLRAMLARLSEGEPTTLGTLQLAVGQGALRSVHASATRDPGGQHFLVAFIDVTEPEE